jgi:hypothetical protein
MGRYLIIWEVDESKLPLNREELKVGWLGAIEMTKQQIKDGSIKDWGVFVGQTKGFDIFEGTEVEVHSTCVKYIPYFRFKVYPLLSMSQTEEIIKTM